MRLNSVLPRSSVAALQSTDATAPAGSTQNTGLQKIQGQSHHEPGKGLSEGLKWRDAKTLGLGRLAQGLLGMGAWLLKGLGSLSHKLGSSTVDAGQRLRSQEGAGRFKQGLGYATQGLGLILKGAGQVFKGAGTVGSLAAKPVGQLITGLEKTGYLAYKGLGRAALSLHQKVVPPQGAEFRQAIESAAREGLRISADQVSALARHLNDPTQHDWPAGLDASLKDMVGRHISAGQVTQLAQHLGEPAAHPWPRSLDPAIRSLIQ